MTATTTARCPASSPATAASRRRAPSGPSSPSCCSTSSTSRGGSGQFAALGNAFHQVEAGAAQLLAVDLDHGGVGAGGGEGGGGGDRHDEALLLALGHAGRPAGLEVGGQALAELDPVGVLDRDDELVGGVGLMPGDVDAEADVEGPLVGQLGQAEDVPAAAGEVELPVHRLRVVGEHEEADVHAGASPSA